MRKNYYTLYIFIISTILISIIYLFYAVYNTKEELSINLQNKFIENAKYLSLNMEKLLKSKISKNLYGTLKENPFLREDLEASLSLFLTPTFQYAYVLYRDKDGKYRYLLDGSKQDKGAFDEPLSVNKQQWDKLYKSSKSEVIIQNSLENLYGTFLQAIIYNGKTSAIIAIDFSTQLPTSITKVIKPVSIIFLYLFIALGLMIIILTWQTILNIKTKKQSITDSLTNLYNRNYLNEIQSSINLQNYSIAMLDLDKFKIINDTYGHKAGDYVLQRSSEILKNSIRDNDIATRYGGEEFLLLLYTRDNKKSGLQICERIRSDIEKYTFNYDGNDILVTVSIGLNKTPLEQKNFNDAVKIADQKLYLSKNSGRNKVTSSLVESINKKITETRDIDFVKQAILDDRIICYFQAIYNNKNNKIVKYESLVRIIDIDGSLVLPNSFLPNITYTTIHFKLTQIILNRSFEMALNNNKSISINLNYSDLIDRDIEKFIVKRLRESEKLASLITFEILESEEINNIELFKEKIALLHSLNATISIDDFGSGFSNFRTVLDIEADYLKIDATLIKNIDKNIKDYAVVKNIILFAKDADMKTIAEYVHSKEVFNKLIDLGVDYMQGYYISKPNKNLINEEKLFT